MKKLISAQEIKAVKAAGNTRISAPLNQYIVTPEARDVATSLGVTIVSDDSISELSVSNKDHQISNDTLTQVQKEIEARLGSVSKDKSALIQELISKELKNFKQTAPDCARQINDNGIVLIRGNAIQLDRFDGAPDQNIGIKDYIGKAENSNMGVGYMGWEKAFFPWLLTYDEVDVVLEGELHIKTATGTTIGKPGDVIFIPKNTQIEFGTPTHVKFVYITYPVMTF